MQPMKSIMAIQQTPRNNSGSEGMRRGHPVYDTTRAQPPDPERNHKNPRHGSGSHNQLRNTRHPLSLALLEAPHGQMGRQIGHDTTLQRTPRHDGPRKGAHNHCQHDATWTAPPRAARFLQPHTTTNRSDHIYGNGM